jgi:prepilin-type N-terminal cleavage/methylation domain-containing protein
MYPNHFAGFSLIEVLVSLLILSFILLGFDALEVYSLRQVRTAYVFSCANNQLNNMIERLRNINGDESIKDQIEQWNKENKIILPQGWGEVKGHFPDYDMSIYWGDSTSHCQQNQIGSSGCITRHIVF